MGLGGDRAGSGAVTGGDTTVGVGERDRAVPGMLYRGWGCTHRGWGGCSGDAVPGGGRL